MYSSTIGYTVCIQHNTKHDTQHNIHTAQYTVQYMYGPNIYSTIHSTIYVQPNIHYNTCTIQPIQLTVDIRILITLYLLLVLSFIFSTLHFISIFKGGN